MKMSFINCVSSYWPNRRRLSMDGQLALPVKSNTGSPNLVTDPLVKQKLIKRKSGVYPLIVHHSHEERFKHYKSRIHQGWIQAFQNTPVMDTKLIVGTKNNLNLEKELVRKSPDQPRHKPAAP